MTRALCIAALAGLAACSAHSMPYGNMAGDPIIDASQLAPEQVRLVQRSLAERDPSVQVTGTYDYDTRIALRQFQATRGLPATGRLDALTVEALGIDPRDVTPVRGAGDLDETWRNDASWDEGNQAPGGNRYDY